GLSSGRSFGVGLGVSGNGKKISKGLIFEKGEKSSFFGTSVGLSAGASLGADLGCNYGYNEGLCFFCYQPEPPIPPVSNASQDNSHIVGSSDPNELIGPAGYGGANYRRGDGLFAYRINFQN